MIPQAIISRTKSLYSNNRIGLLRQFEGLEELKRIRAQFFKIFRSQTLPAVEIKFLFCDDLLEVIKGKRLKIQSHHCIGDLSWEIRVIIDPKIKNGMDWDEKLGAKYGVVPILKYVINHYVGCYSSWCYTMAFDKKTKIYEFNPIKLPKNLIPFKRKIESALRKLGFAAIAKADFDTKIPNVTTDTIHKGPVKFFDLVFTDIYGHEFEKSRFTSDPISVKSTFRELQGKNSHFYEESVTLNNGDNILVLQEIKPKSRLTLTYTNKKGKKWQRIIVR